MFGWGLCGGELVPVSFPFFDLVRLVADALVLQGGEIISMDLSQQMELLIVVISISLRSIFKEKVSG